MYFSVFKGEHPSALNVLMQGVNGQKFTFDEYESCMTCGELKAERKCSACRMVCTKWGFRFFSRFVGRSDIWSKK